MKNVRELALGAIENILHDHKKPRVVVDSLSTELDRKDRTFLMEIVYGVIRWKDRLDWIINRFLKKPSGVKGYTRDNLRLGIYQIFNLKVPDWAAVDESVKLELKNRSLVNAVLRNAIRDKDKVVAELNEMRNVALDESVPLARRVSNISVLTSHPKWLIRRWTTRFDAKETLGLAEANNQIPPLTLRVNVLKATRDEILSELNKSGIKASPTTMSPVGIKLHGTHPISDIAAYFGKIYIQDEAAQLVSGMLDLHPGDRALDACAAPGGKTTHMAEIMGDKGEIVAIELDADRIKPLKENISMMGHKCIKVLHGDIQSVEGLGLFDKVLADAPCSSIGVIRRNPDIKYRHTAGDLAKFKEKQMNILLSASRFLAPGGTLVFSTCSTEPEEGEQVIEEFLKTSSDFYKIKGITVAEDYFMRTYPHRHDMDGFFGAKIMRQK